MDIRQLRYFLEIVEQNSITAASRTLNIAQPALSHHLRNMEQSLGVALLIRKPTGVEPTEAGHLLASRARSILNDIARTKDEIRNLDQSPVGTVRLGLPGTISEIITLPLMEVLRERYPRITLNTAEAMSGFVRNWLEQGRIDLAILYTKSTDPRLAVDTLVNEELVLIVPADQPVEGPISLAQLSEFQLILPSKGHGLRDLIETVMRECGAQINVSMEIDSFRNIKSLVAKGFGVSILPLHAVAEEVASGLLFHIRFAAPGLRRNVFLARTRSYTPAQNAVEDALQNVISDLVTTGKWAGAILPIN